MGTTLSGKTPATTFDALIKVGDNSALTATLKTISDGLGNDSPLKLSTDAVGVGSITNIETEIGGKQATLVSGTNIKTINSSSLLGSGDVAVQETLVSGTNIKTINSTSLLGSGDISISASPSGSNTQIQFNDSGAFGADSLFNWDNTNKRLGVGETTPTARLHVKGVGATSATTALLVENSSGTDTLEVRDDGRVVAGKGAKTNANGTFNVFHGVSNLTTRVFTVSRDSVLRGMDINSGGATKISDSSGDQSFSHTATAVLEVSSTTKGFLPPRMTGEQRDAIEATAGLIVYNTTDNNLNYYNGTSWTSI